MCQRPDEPTASSSTTHPAARPGRHNGDGEPTQRTRGTTFLKASLLAALLVLVELWSIHPSSRPAQAAQPPATRRAGGSIYPDSSLEAEAFLRSADSHARDGQYAEAVTLYLKVMDQYGGALGKIPRDSRPNAADPAAADPAAESTLYVDLRSYCQRRIAAMPPEGRAIYRAKVEGLIEPRYQEARRRRDEAELRRIATEAFASSRGDDALDLAGDLAFRSGRFAEALECYRQLVSDRTDQTKIEPGLVHPDPDIDLARVAAKKLLCRAALGYPLEPADLERYRATYPEARGNLFNREGLYADVLASAIAEDRWSLSGVEESRWPTFAGAPNRSTMAREAIEVGEGSYQWRVKLAPVLAPTGGDSVNQFNRFNRFGGPDPNANAKPTLAYHPIILGDLVLVGDESKVWAYPLDGGDASPAKPEGAPSAPVDPAPVEGQVTHRWMAEHRFGGVTAPLAQGLPGPPPRFTLTAHGGRLFARLGPSTSYSVGYRTRLQPSAVVAFDLSREGKKLWIKDARQIPLTNQEGGRGGLAAFEGTPVADDYGVYVALTEGGSGPMSQIHVACLDPATGEPKWTRFLFQSNLGDDPEAFMMRGGRAMMGNFGLAAANPGHRLLSLEAGTLYYQTNLGAVAAIDASDGRIRWLATYPRATGAAGTAAGEARDLNPAVVADGRVFVAPRDSDALFAFDALTGRLLWKTDPNTPINDIAHLLGVASGHLVATGNHVYLFDAATGRLTRRWPENPAGLTGQGRGLLAGNRVYWPTQSQIHVLSITTGLRDQPPIELAKMFQTGGGNLAVGDGFLAVAQQDALVLYCQNRRVIQRYRQILAERPADPAACYRLAQALEREGQTDEARAFYRQTIAAAGSSDLIDGRPLAEEARDRLYRLAMRLGEARSSAGAFAEAAEWFEEARTEAHKPQDRLTALFRLADVHNAGNRPEDAVTALQTALADPQLRDLQVNLEGGRIVRADALVVRRLQDLIKTHGPEVYARSNQVAQALVERGRRDRDPRLLERVEREFPVAQALPEALLSLARLREAADQPSEAALAYKRLLDLADAIDPPLRAQALWGLGQAYQAQRLWVSARDVYRRIEREFATVVLTDPDRAQATPDAAQVTLGQLVSRALQAPEFRGVADFDPDRRPDWPLQRVWERAWRADWAADSSPREGDEMSALPYPLVTVGRLSSRRTPRLLLTQGRQVRAVDPADGSIIWSARLDGRAEWSGSLPDRIVVATRNRVWAFDPLNGQTAWVWPAPPDPLDAENPAADPSVVGNESVNPFRPNVGIPGLPAGDDDPDRRLSPLEQFRVLGDRVLVLRGNSELVALEGANGRPVWSYLHARGRLHNRFLAHASSSWLDRPQEDGSLEARGFVLLQIRQPNAIVALDAATGRLLAEMEQAADAALWERDPIFLGGGKVGVVADRRTIQVFDLERRGPLWSRAVSNTLPNLSPPLLVGDASALVVLINGRILDRLDPLTGERLWAEPVPLGEENLGERPDAILIRDNAILTVNQGLLQSHRISDGGLNWKKRLHGAEEGWNLAPLDQGVAVYPDPQRVAARRFVGDFLPITLHRLDDGRLLQRLVFPTAETQALVIRFEADGLTVATNQAGWFLAAGRSSPAAPSPPPVEREDRR